MHTRLVLFCIIAWPVLYLYNRKPRERAPSWGWDGCFFVSASAALSTLMRVIYIGKVCIGRIGQAFYRDESR